MLKYMGSFIHEHINTFKTLLIILSKAFYNKRTTLCVSAGNIQTVANIVLASK